MHYLNWFRGQAAWMFKTLPSLHRKMCTQRYCIARHLCLPATSSVVSENQQSHDNVHELSFGQDSVEKVFYNSNQ